MNDAIADLKRLAGPGIYRRYLKLEPASGGNQKALCPWHPDHDPSLVVYPDGHHKCYACGARGDSLDLIQKVDGCDFAAAMLRLKEIVGVVTANPSSGNNTASSRNPVKTYPYVDETGELLFEVCRYDPKDFRQRRPDGKGGWIWNLGDVRKPLYRLPEVLKASEVWLVEGEKDVETLRKLGLTATTVAGGADVPLLSEHSDALTGKKVYIVADNHKKGRACAQKRCRHLEGFAEEVLVIELPGVPQKGDVTDFFDVGNTVEDLRVLIVPARERSIEAHKPWWQGLPTLSSLEAPPVRYLVPHLLPEGALVLLVAKPASYKSFLSLDLCRAVSSGTSFAGLAKSDPRPVLYLDGENPLNAIVSRRELLAIPETPNFRYWGRFSGRPFPALDDSNLREFAAKERPLIIVDSFIRFHKGSENDNAEVAATMAHFLDLTRSGATVLLLHHAGKDKTKLYRGAMELEAAPDVCIRCERIGDGEIQLTEFKNRFGPERITELKLSEGGFRCLSEPEPSAWEGAPDA